MEEQDLSEFSFKDIYYNEFNSLIRVALYVVKDPGIAEDVVQEVFIKLWEKREGIEGIHNLKAYLMQMTRNLALDKLEASKKLQKRILELEYSHTVSTTDDKAAAVQKAVEEAISYLTPKCRLVFSLSRFEGLTNDEIAEYLSISKRTVETQISNALRAFRTDLKPVFEHHLSPLLGASLLVILQQL